MAMRVAHWWLTVPLRLRSLFSRRRVEREMDEEIRFHIEQKTEEGIAAGLAPDAARAAALRAFGGVAQQQEAIRDTRGLNWLTDFVADVRYAIRGLRRAGGLTVFVVLALALGIGLTAAAFSMLDSVVFRPYPVPQPERVLTLMSASRDNPFDSFSYREFRDIAAAARSFSGVAAATGLVTVGYAPDARTLPRVRGAMLVSGDYFRVLGVEPRIGRSFRPDEDQIPDRTPVVVLGRDFWKHEFAADPGVVGRTIRLNGREFTVVGVAPERFPGMNVFSNPDLYAPLAMANVLMPRPTGDFFEDRDDRRLVLRARLAPGAPVAAAKSEMAVIARGFERDHPESGGGRRAAAYTQVELRTRADDINWKFGVVFTVLALAVVLVACTNVAGLLLSRARARTREMAVRLALGAGRSRVIRMMLTESLVLALLGGAAGVGVGFVGIELLRTFSLPTELPSAVPFRMDVRVLGACLVLAVSSAFVFGLAPALQSLRTDIVSGLKEGEVGETGRRRMWGRNALVVAQVAISLTLVTVSFLMARSFAALVTENAAVPKDQLLMARFNPALVRYDLDRAQRFYAQLIERLAATPGVTGAALTRNPPLGLGNYDRIALIPDGFDLPPDRDHLTVPSDVVDEGYFATLGIAIRRGRGFRAADDTTAPRVAVVNEAFAARYWPGREAVGRLIHFERRGGEVVEVVGVAADVHREGLRKGTPFLYLPYAQRPASGMIVMVKTAGPPLEMTDALRGVVRGLDPDLPVSELRTYADLYRFALVDGPAIAIRLTGIMGGVALMLAIAGLYGLVAYNVSRRTREIGIRMAIGATPRDILELVTGQGLRLVAIGTVIGLALSLAVERLMKAALFQDAGVDPVAYLVVVPALAAVTLLAAWLPARRAARIAPTEALRCE